MPETALRAADAERVRFDALPAAWAHDRFVSDGHRRDAREFLGGEEERVAAVDADLVAVREYAQASEDRETVNPDFSVWRGEEVPCALVTRAVLQEHCVSGAVAGITGGDVAVCGN